MGLFDAFKKKKAISFEEIDSIEKAQDECKKGNLERMHIMSPIFGDWFNRERLNPLIANPNTKVKALFPVKSLSLQAKTG